MTQLVLVHGRAQQHKDSLALKGEWIAALREGLKRAHLALPIDEDKIRFPYYGDTLADLSHGMPPEAAADVIVRGTTPESPVPAYVEDLIKEIAHERGITDAQVRQILGEEVVQRGFLNWEWVQGILKVIDRHVPFGSGASVALFTNDAYQYLHNPTIRTDLENGVRDAFTSDDPMVVVSHSLGTIVSYNLLRHEGTQQGWQVPLFVTLGSPLGIKIVKQRLAPNQHPACVGHWFNALDERDVVALYPLSVQHFPITPEIENYSGVSNHTTNRHGIAGYLDDPTVATRIHNAL